jgi:Ca2+-binding RTX toxin-like protein
LVDVPNHKEKAMPTINGTSANDSLLGSESDDVISGFGGNDSLFGGGGHDSLLGGDGNDQLRGDDGNDTIIGGAGNDSIVGGFGIDTADYFFSDSFAGVMVDLNSGNATGGGGTDTLSGIENVNGTDFNDTIFGDGSANFIEGRGGNDSLFGMGGDDNLQGGSGDDTILGGGGSDFIVGGSGNDSIDGGVSVDFYFGTDQNSVWYGSATSSVFLDMRGVTGDGSVGQGFAYDGEGGTDTLANVSLYTGSGYNDTILGSDAGIFESFDGGLGDDVLNGGAYETVFLDAFNRLDYRNAPGSVTVDLRGGFASGAAGNDTILNFHSVHGSNSADTLLGSDTTLYTEQFEGRGGNDTIDGRGGNDLVRYGYVTNNTSTGVYVNLATGVAIAGVGDVDTLISIERVRGSQYNDSLIGGNPDNGADQFDGFEDFRGDAGNDWIDGGDGYDQANYGGASSGVYVVLGGTGAGFAYDGQGGIDTLINIEQVYGSFYDDYLVGSDSADFESFEGQIGNDTIDGRGGVDRVTYYGSRAGVTVNLETGIATEFTLYGGTTMGTDTLLNIEWARGSEGFGDSLIGNSGANKLEGLGGDDTMDGGLGADTMEGGNGSDLYIVRDVDDVVTETNRLRATGGDDTVVSYVTTAMSGAGWVLGDYVENLRIGTTAAANGSGNSLDNIIYANVGNNVLNGGAGVDTISFEHASAGVVASIASTAVGPQATGGSGSDTLLNFENITGGSGNDALTGSAQANVLSGGLGADTLTGGLGDDTYVVDNAGDVIVETSAVGSGIEQVLSSVTYSLAALANVENLTLTGSASINATGNGAANILVGNSGNNSITGAGGNDTLDGGLGADTMVGGDGNDTYMVDSASDIVVELGGQGIDLIRSTVSYSLVDTDGAGGNGGNVENLELVGSDINGTGNGLDNIIYAGDGNNVIDGGGGNDTVSYAWATAPVQINLAIVGAQGTGGSGSDTLISIEYLEGSAFADSLGGSTDLTANLLSGLAGSDSFYGLSGNDTVMGGEGGDYINAGGVGNMVIDGGEVLDLWFGLDMNYVSYAQASAGIVANLSGITGVGSTGSGTVIKGNAGGTDTLINVSQLFGSQYDDSITGSSALTWESFEGGLGNDTINGGAMQTPVGSRNIDNANRIGYGSAISAVTVNLGTGVVTGGAGSDVISNFNEVRGSNYDDVLIGSSFGFEQFEGGSGNDTIDGAGGFDRVRYGSASAAVYVNLATGYADDGSGGVDTLSNLEMIVGSRFNDTLIGGNAANDVLEMFRAEAGNDMIDGGSGFDMVDFANARSGAFVKLGGLSAGYAYDGQGGVDTLISIEGARGSTYDDRFLGSDSAVGEKFEGLAGNDTFDGGLGNDTLTGDAGSDTFKLSLGSNDTVTDFATGLGGDILDLTAILAVLTNYTAGSNPFASGHLRLTQSGANTLVQADSDGPGAGGFQTVGTLSNVTAANIVAANIAGGFDVPLANKVANDFDGDGKSDVLWKNTANGQASIWKSANGATAQVVATLPDQNWKVMGLGDFDGDGKADILFRNTTTGVNTIWKTGNSATSQSVSPLTNQDWKVMGVGDFDGDGKADILWRNGVNGQASIWKSGNGATSQAVSTISDQNWKMSGVGDFDGDGKADILWRNTATGVNTIWKGGNSATSQSVSPLANQDFKVAGVGDFDGDGKSDILWRNSTSGVNAIWKSGNGATVQAVNMLSDMNWNVVGTGDYDGDGKADILWRNSATGVNAIWKSANSATSQSVSPISDQNWAVLDGLESGDLLRGGAGANTLYGTINADVLYGAAGADTMTGGLGVDQFRYLNAAEGQDSITDFASGIDKIQVVGSGFGGLAAGALSGAKFIAGASPVANQAAQFLYNTTTGVLAFDADGAGGVAAVNLVTLVGHPAITATDLQVVAA